MYTPLLFIGGLGGWEVLLIVSIVMLLFGAKKLPELAKGLGTGIREFKSSVSDPIKKEMEADEHKHQNRANTPVAEKETVVEKEQENGAVTAEDHTTKVRHA